MSKQKQSVAVSRTGAGQGARGPLAVLDKHPQRHELFQDLVLFQHQRTHGVGEDEDRILLKDLAKKYGTSSKTLSRYLETRVQAMLNKVRETAEAVGFSYLDPLMKVRAYEAKVERLYAQYEKEERWDDCRNMLNETFPIMLEKLTSLYPKPPNEKQDIPGLEHGEGGGEGLWRNIVFNVVGNAQQAMPQGQGQEEAVEPAKPVGVIGSREEAESEADKGAVVLAKPQEARRI